MGRPKTTGCSHNKFSTTYRSERKILTTLGGQKKLTDLFKSKVQEKAAISDNEQQSTSSFSSPSSSVGIVPVNISYDVNENEILITLLIMKIWILKLPLMDVHI